MTRDEFKVKASGILSRYSNETEVYFTSDGRPFFSDNAAANHAKTLEDKELVKITRSDVKELASKLKADDGTEEVTLPLLDLNKPVPTAPAKAATGTKTQAAKPAKAAKSAKAGEPAKTETKAADTTEADGGDSGADTQTGEGEQTGENTKQGGEQ